MSRSPLAHVCAADYVNGKGYDAFIPPIIVEIRWGDGQTVERLTLQELVTEYVAFRIEADALGRSE